MLLWNREKRENQKYLWILFCSREKPIKREKTKLQTEMVLSFACPGLYFDCSLRTKSKCLRFTEFHSNKKIDYVHFKSTVQIRESTLFLTFQSGLVVQSGDHLRSCTMSWDHCGTIWGSFAGLCIFQAILSGDTRSWLGMTSYIILENGTNIHVSVDLQIASCHFIINIAIVHMTFEIPKTTFIGSRSFDLETATWCLSVLANIVNIHLGPLVTVVSAY